MILHCPALTAFYGNNASGSFASNVKLGGLFIIQTANPNLAIFSPGNFSRINEAYTLSNLYGSQGNSIATNLFIWAQKLTFFLEAPEMTRTGTVTYGCFPLSSAWDLSNLAQLLTVNQLLKATTGKPIDLK